MAQNEQLHVQALTDVNEDGSSLAFARERFQNGFGRWPDTMGRAPGRVNLVGEHIDYEGYGVLPMAIQQDCIVAVGKTEGRSIRLLSSQPAAYPELDLSISPPEDIDATAHNWGKYFMAAHKGVLEYVCEQQMPAVELTALQVLVHGTVPPGAGLSSSSACVVASVLALLALYQISATRAAVAELACRCERHVGTAGGGMDQAVSVLARAGAALAVEFDPVRATEVQLPVGGTFVIANSLAPSHKADTAATRYNLRVVECRLAAAVLLAALGAAGEKLTVKTLKEAEEYAATRAGLQGQEALLSTVKHHLHEGAYSAREVSDILGVELEQLFAGSRAHLRVLDAAASQAPGTGGFQLRDRALHVYSEAARVRAFKAACDDAQIAGPAAALSTLGRLMNESHASCAELYRCSCPELDELVGVARAAGALGARLTGAGWGGCIVALVPEAQVAGFVRQLHGKYYKKVGVMSDDHLAQCVFTSRPADGASVYALLASPNARH